MKLNPDCIRDLLFAIEELSDSNSLILSTKLLEMKSLSNYSKDEVLYHIRQLDWSGYIVTPNKNKFLDGTYIITDLSPAGHEFISNIREDTNWNKVKNISKEVGSSTLKSLQTIAENVISTAISSALGMH